MTPSLSDQVNTASTLLGLLLALDTLFTAEQSRRLAEERSHVGGARSQKLLIIRATAAALAVVTAAAIVALFPLFRDVFDTIGHPSWQPVLAVFELTWLLLVALTVWQITIAWRAH